MAFHNRTEMTVSGTPGTGTITLLAAIPGRQSFNAGGVANGEKLTYLAVDGNAWELGWGAYTTSGTTLTRNLIASSTGSLLALTSAATVASTIIAEQLQWTEIANAAVPAASVTPVTFSNIPPYYNDLLMLIEGVGLTTTGSIDFRLATQATPSTFGVSGDLGGSYTGGSTYNGGFLLPAYMKDRSPILLGLDRDATSPAVGTAATSTASTGRYAAGGIGGMKFTPSQNWASGTFRLMGK